MRRIAWIFIAALILVVAAPASADVVIHFVSGKTMPAKAVQYVDDMVQVDLGGDGQIAFPRSAIEKVEVPERRLDLQRNTALSRQNSPMVAGKTEAAGTRSGSSGVQQAPLRRNPGVPSSVQQQMDKYGMAVTNAVPMGNSYAATRLKNVVQPDPYAARNNNVAGGGSIRGTQQAGGRYVMAGDQAPQRPKAVAVRLTGNSAPPAPEPEPEPPADTRTDSDGN